MGTPHNEAQTGDIAKTVLMPGDPDILRTVLKQITSVR